ncbi:MAG: AAA family ATPase [Desulfurococcales archaeon]|nr:AAA family ATPase [Desulfurococcales archaeon]
MVSILSQSSNISPVTKISGIRLENFRSYDSFPEDNTYFLELGDLTTLIGKNDSGKSNILHAIMIFQEGKAIQKDDFHRFRTDKSVKIFLKFKVNGINKLITNLIEEEQKSFINKSSNEFCIVA